MIKTIFIAIAFLLSFLNYSFEFMLIQSIADTTNSDILSINLVIGFFMLSLGVGSLYYDRYLKDKDNGETIIKTEIIIGISSIILFITISLSELLNNLTVHPLILEKAISIPFEIFQGNDSLSIENFFIKIALLPIFKTFITNISIFMVSFILGFFSGVELPLLINLSKKHNITQNYILGINYFGSLAASFLFVFYFKPVFSIITLVLLFAFSYIVISLIISILLNNHKFIKLNLLIIIAIPVISIPIQNFNKEITKLSTKAFYFPPDKNLTFFKKMQEIQNAPKVTETSTKYQKVHKVYYKDTIGLFLNNKYQLRLDNEYYYHESMVQIPISLFKIKPKKILLLGAGDGFLLRELSNLGLTDITHIELDQEFMEYCKQDPDISFANNYMIKNYKNVIFNDAFYMVQKIKSKFDFIIIDFPHPHSYDLSKLYSIEFILNVKKLLSDDGLIVMDVPIKNEKNLIQEESLAFGSTNNNIIYSTFKKANFKTLFFYSVASDGFVILSNNKLEKNFNFKSTNMNPNTLTLANQLINESIPFYFDSKLVNSIFKPLIFKFKE